MSDLLPFSQNQFFAVFAAYNAAIWPAPVVAYALGTGAAVLVLRSWWTRAPQVAGNAAIVIVLALMWAWTGVVYHWIFFSAINPAALPFGVLFVSAALILFVNGVAQRRIHFGRPQVADALVGVSFVVYAMVIYPLIGLWTGHAYPAAPVFGATPCPVTIFTFGLLLLTTNRMPWVVIALPVIWSLIGGSAALLLGVVQDWVLLFSGVVSAVLFARRGV